MATSGYSEDLQPQQANTVTIATPAATTPSSAKTAHFLSEIPPPGPVASANQSAAASKTGQDALCSQAPPTQAQSQKAVVLTTPTQHYVTPEIQHSAVQKSNGQSSPQYIIVTVTGERLMNEWYIRHTVQTRTHTHNTNFVAHTGSRRAWYGMQSVSFSLYSKSVSRVYATVWILTGD